MFKRMTLGEKIFQIWLIIFMVILCMMMVYPFVHTLAISFSTPAEAMRPGIHIIPKEWSLDAYRTVFSDSAMWRTFFYTVYKTTIFTICSMSTMVAAAYALSKKRLPYRVPILLAITFTMYFGGGLIPTYLLVKNLGLLDTTTGLVLTGLVNTFSLIILKNYFAQIPEELEESAKIDGANDIVILWKIILPVSKPILATVLLWTVVADWNDWFRAMIYMQSPDRTVLQVMLRRLIVENNDMMLKNMVEDVQRTTPETMKAAILMVTIAPIVLVYPFLQKYFVTGIMVGSVKG